VTINTNSSAAAASHHLSKNQSALQKSLVRLSSGSRIVQPVDDAGGLAVSMKMESAIVRLSGAQKNVQNATSFLEVQDGVLQAAGKIVNRMIELKGLSDDVMKNSSDVENYNSEFKDLQMQIYDMASLKFNGVSLFATTTTRNGSTSAVFNDATADNTVSVYVSADGTSGPVVSISKALLLSALTIDTDALGTGKAYVTSQQNGSYTSGDDITFAAESAGKTINITDISVGVFTQALENLATLRAGNGGSMSRLRFAGEEMAAQETNLIAARGRVVDVDIAAESTRLAKYNVLVQASASMLAQANTSADIALMLLR
ncbi:MAG: flagellin, partial [Pseudomonadota bacterium]|nr:flagellin [Pseudomonadota bacterium]